MEKATYKTFAELASYARQRAQRSANRRGHQEFVYWCRVHRWALEEMRRGADVLEQLRGCLFAIKHPDEFDDEIEDTAWMYAQAVHLRKMLVNQGRKVEPLSLQWLRDAAAALEDDER